MGHLGCPYLFSINEMLVHVSTSILSLPCPLSLLNTWHRWLALQSLEMFRAQVHALPNCVLSPLLPTTRTSSVKMGEQGCTTRRGTATPVHRPQRPAGSTHSSTRGLRPPEQLERPAGFPSSAEKAMAPHSSTLAWKIPGRLQFMRSLRVGPD